MKTHKITKRFFTLAMCLCLICGMLPMAAHAAETTYYTITYTDGVDGEEIFADQVYTIAAGESIVYFDTTKGSLNREGYSFNGWTPKLETTVTKNVTYTALWNEWVETGYTITYTDGVDGEEIFEDQVYTDVASGTSTPAFEGTPTRTGFTFKGWTPDVAETVTGDATYTALWEEIHTHSYSTATCSTPATCSCGATTGGVDSTNHTGRTEVRGQKDATEFEEGYTGDTYCLGCNTMIKQGEVIGATHTHSYTKEAYHSTGHYTECDCGEKTEVQAHSYTGILDATCDCGYNRGLFVTNDDGKDFYEVGFIPGDGVTLPDDAELVVEDHYPSLAPIASFLGQTVETEPPNVTQEVNVEAVDIQNHFASTFTGPGEVEYTHGELLLIDGKEYYLYPGSGSGKLQLLDKDGILYDFDGTNPPESTGTKRADFPEKDEYISINGAVYQVLYSEKDKVVLYMDGKIVGEYLNYGALLLYGDDYHPDKVNERQQDDNDLGTVTIPADYNNAAIADFAPGKTYKVSVVGANDISVEGYDDALLNSITEDTPEIAAAKAELERREADMGAKLIALTLMDINDPNYTDAEIAYHEASRAYASARASLADLTNLQGATVSQTFKIPDALVGAKNVQYVAVHDTNPYADALAKAEQAVKYDPYDERIQLIYESAKSRYDGWEAKNGSGAEFGTVTLSLDGLTLTATHTAVKGFSPFIVYAFVEADEPVYKELSATIDDGNDTNLTWLWITVAILAAGAAATTVIYTRKKKK